MAVILKNDLYSVQNLKSYLQQDLECTTNMINAINKFIACSKDKLRGPAWDNQRMIFEQYKNVFEKRKSALSSMLAVLPSATNQMLNYMEDYDKLDTSELTSLQSQHFRLDRKIGYLWGLLSKAIESGNISSLKSEISRHTSNLRTIAKGIEKLRNLVPTSQSASAKVDSAVQQMNGLISQMSSLK